MSITIRNLAPVSLHVSKVERFHGPEPVQSISSFVINVIKSLVSLIWSSPAVERTELPDDAKPFETQSEDVHIDAFSSIATTIRAPEPGQTIRLLFEVESQQYRLDLPVFHRHSATLIPLDSHEHNFTAIYSREHTHLAILATAKLSSWMQALTDETPLTSLSLPGTHNSPTYHRALPSVRCQAVSPREQMENGIRFFDIRAQVEKPENPKHDGLILVHSVFPISLTGRKYFRDLAEEILDFLRSHPSETMVISLKREGTGEGSDQQFANILRQYYAVDEQNWYTKPQIPTLGEVRGKIILLRRFHLSQDLRREHNGQGWGINAETWADNTPHALTPDKTICVQDFYEVLETVNIEKKITYSIDQLKRAAANTSTPPFPTLQARWGPAHEKPPFFLNFLSASNFWKQGCWPENIAAKLNPAVVDYLCREHSESQHGDRLGDGATGIVVCDWVGDNGDWDLVRCIVGHNAKLQQKGYRH